MFLCALKEKIFLELISVSIVFIVNIFIFFLLFFMIKTIMPIYFLKKLKPNFINYIKRCFSFLLFFSSFLNKNKLKIFCSSLSKLRTYETQF